MGGALGACATPAAQAPLSSASAAEPHVASAGELSELGSFADHGAPKGVVIWLRVPAPGRDIPLLGTLLGLGSMVDPSDMLNHKFGPVLGATVDLSKPVDLTTSGLDDGPMHIALAAGIFDPSAFVKEVSRDFRVAHKGQGRWRLVPKSKPRSETLECELWHAAPPVGARLICASQASLIDQQGEFLMSAARTRVDRSNFHAELPGSAAQDVLRKSAAQRTSTQRGSAADEEPGVAAGRAMGERWISDWVADSSGFSWDLTLRRDSVELSQAIGFSRSDSLVSTALAGRAGPLKAVPDAFWQLPNDSDAALYWEGAEPEPMRKRAAAMIHEVRASLEKDDEFQTPPENFDHFERSFASLILRGGAFELAYGRDLSQAARALNEAAEHAADRGPRSGSADPALKKAQAELGAWGLLGIEDDSRAYLEALRDALHFAADKTEYPRKKGAKGGAPSPSSLHFRELPLPASAGLPAGALHFTISSEPNPKYVAAKAKPAPSAPSTDHVFAVPDTTQHLWLAIASDEGQALARLRSVLSPEPAKTLGVSEDLRQLAKEPVAGLGFVTLAAVNGFGLSAASKEKVQSSRHALKQLWSLPKRGSTRVPIWITREPAGAAERRVVYNVRLTPDAIGDLLATFMTSGSDAEGRSE